MMSNSTRKQWKSKIPKVIALLISSAILLVLYAKVDLSTLHDVFRKMNYDYISPLLISFVAIYLLVALRWVILAQPYCTLTYSSAMKMIVSSSSLNIIVPSKLGSFAKAYFMASKGIVDTKTAISMTMYEKFSDLAAMSAVFIVSAVIHHNYDMAIILILSLSLIIIICFVSLHKVNVFNCEWIKRLRGVKAVNRIIEILEVIYIYQKSPSVDRQCLIHSSLISLALWSVHTIQLSLFFYLLDLRVPIYTISTYMICAIFVGLLPITIAGMGTRDLAILYLFDGLLTYSEAICIGILSTLRYIIPTVIGLPFLIHIMISRKHRSPGQRLS